MTQMRRNNDYFSFESIRDKDGEVVCYHITMIGTIEEDGLARMRTDLGNENDKKYAFGRLTVRGCDRKINVLLNETDSRVYYHNWNEEEGAVDIISFAARDWRADEVYNYNAGDRVLIEGRAYLRRGKNDPEGKKAEMTVTVTGQFLLGRRRRVPAHQSLIPQKGI